MLKNLKKHKLQILVYLQLILLFSAFIIYLLKVQDTVKNILQHGIIFISLSLSVIATIFIERKLTAVSTKEAQISTREAMAGDMEKLAKAMEEQNKDFISHMESISRYMNNGQINEIGEYLDNISGKVTHLNDVLKVNNSIIGALLNSKLAEANTRNIHMDIKSDIPLDRLGEPSLSLARIMGNLIDNAFDAVIAAEQIDRYVSVKLYQTGPLWQVEVYNKGPVINPRDMDHIFIEGYSDKGKGHSGMGLHIVKSLTEKLAGTVKVSSDKRGTRFIVVIPAR